MRRSVDINTAFFRLNALKYVPLDLRTLTFSGPLLVIGDTAAPTWLLLSTSLSTLALRGLTAHLAALARLHGVHDLNMLLAPLFSTLNLWGLAARGEANSEENTFFTTAQSFALFSESISGIGQPRRCNCGFGPATVPTTSTLPEAMEEDQQFEYSTLYTGDGRPVQVLTPRCGQPPVVAPARGRSITQIESPILQAIAHRTGKQPQCRATSQSPCDLPPYFDLDAGDHDDQDPPVDPDDLGSLLIVF
ncbi:hypothetical protein C8J55DRAFT_558481 [Lentinula edodes]|uniref:Uncharacterized protein n=1 Tax=Lentinula lateritia TaxID=40482 RepID=A0A9W9AP80_9AGAR|nr:hypothetical protein C8J55DRAFT_558481 [Lentinula edodes]